MKKLTVVCVCFFVVVFCSGVVSAANSINAGSWEDALRATSSITVEDLGNAVKISIKNPRFTPAGKNIDRKEWSMPEKVYLYSGILDAANIKKAFVEAKVINGDIEFTVPNSGKIANVAVVEHIWGFSSDRKMALVLDPNDSWVCFKARNDGTPDLNTLAIGIIMYPNGPTKPLKPFGKLPQGKHPELADKK